MPKAVIMTSSSVPAKFQSVLSNEQAAALVNEHEMYLLPVMQVHNFMVALEKAIREQIEITANKKAS